MIKANGAAKSWGTSKKMGHIMGEVQGLLMLCLKAWEEVYEVEGPAKRAMLCIGSQNVEASCHQVFWPGWTLGCQTGSSGDEAVPCQEQIMQHVEPCFELLTINVRKLWFQGFKKSVLFYQILVWGQWFWWLSKGWFRGWSLPTEVIRILGMWMWNSEGLSFPPLILNTMEGA